MDSAAAGPFKNSFSVSFILVLIHLLICVSSPVISVVVSEAGLNVVTMITRSFSLV